MCLFFIKNYNSRPVLKKRVFYIEMYEYVTIRNRKNKIIIIKKIRHRSPVTYQSSRPSTKQDTKKKNNLNNEPIKKPYIYWKCLFLTWGLKKSTKLTNNFNVLYSNVLCS